MRHILLFFLLTLLISSCKRELSSDVNQDRIFTQYELFYDANEDITYARAWFRFGNETGTLLELASPSKVTFEGDKLSFNGVLAYYEKKYTGFKSSGKFHWEDTDGKSFDNMATIHPISFGVVPDSVARNIAFSIPWTGDPLGDKELVGVWINGENEGDAQATVTIENGAANIIMPANQMEKIGAGPGKIYIQRRFFPDLTEETGAGGWLHGVYRPKFESVVFK
jgi:hypothetical protein